MPGIRASRNGKINDRPCVCICWKARLHCVVIKKVCKHAPPSLSRLVMPGKGCDGRTEAGKSMGSSR